MKIRLLGRRFWDFGLRTVFELFGVSLLMAAIWYIFAYCYWRGCK